MFNLSPWTDRMHGMMYEATINDTYMKVLFTEVNQGDRSMELRSKTKRPVEE